MKKTRIGIFASGTGSNAMNLIKYFKNHASIEVAFVLTNKKSAPIVESAQKEGVEVIICTNEDVSKSEFLIEICENKNTDWIVLAGYLRLIPEDFIHQYENKIINLHPSLLPKYGGKGMFGGNVHKAVIENKESISGITIHMVNSEFDKGRIIAQFTCTLKEDDNAFDLSKKIAYLEHSYLPTVIENTINQ